MMEDYFMKKNQAIDEHKADKKKEKRDKRLFDRLMVEACIRFIEFRKRRFIEKISSLRVFLSQTYKEAEKEFPDLIKAEFRHRTYGESAKLRSNKNNLEISFPLSFKRYFFSVLK